jgi:NAD(P)-dependent dehydrogenase (short-subunit alcohol dehydrogenase family)
VKGYDAGNEGRSMSGIGIDLSQKTAVIVGGASGLGAAIAQGMSAAGAPVVLVDLDGEKLHAVQEQIARTGGACRSLNLDVADSSAPERIVDFTLSEFGSLKILVLSAGIHNQAPFESMTSESFERVFAVNVRAPYFISQAALPHLSPGGSIILIGSTGAIAAIPGGFSAYCATKGAIHSLVRALAVELAERGVRVNAIVPGAFDTPINATLFSTDPELAATIVETTPLKRLGEPEDIVAPALFLASDGARHVHGAMLVVDGGFTVV